MIGGNEMKFKNTPNIGGYVDLCCYLATGKELLLVNNKIVANKELNCCVESAYNFLFSDSKLECERAIQENLYMFNITESNNFYYANDNMFSGSNAQYGIKGQVLKLKEKYK
jgi:hypothetical protein